MHRGTVQSQEEPAESRVECVQKERDMRGVQSRRPVPGDRGVRPRARRPRVGPAGPDSVRRRPVRGIPGTHARR